MNITIVVPSISEGNAIADGLRSLTAAIHTVGLADGSAGGILGGEYGYGANIENDVFMMHRYCWCDSSDCPWCAGCECPDTTHHYFIDDKEVSYGQWMRFYEDYVYGSGKTIEDWWERKHDGLEQPELEQREHDKRSDEANVRRSTRHDPICRICRGEFGNAPNFLHKSSGSRINWYKYIGRSMEVKLTREWADILMECLNSLESPSPSA